MIESTTVKVSYSTDGATTSFPITFPFDVDTNIKAWMEETASGTITQLDNPDDFSVSGENLVLVDIWLTGYTLLIKRVVPLLQETGYIYKDPLRSEVLEDDYDYSMKAIQQLQEQMDRAPKLPETSDLTDIELPEPEEGKFMIWRSGALENVQHYVGSGYDIETFIEEFLEADDADEAFEALGADAAWHLVGGGGEPAFENDWSNVGGAYEVAAYRITANGWVFLKGRVDGGAIDTVVFTLPATYRPSAAMVFAMATEAAAWLQIAANGEVSVITQ